MTSHPARDMRGVVQKPEHHRDSAAGADVTRRPHETMSDCVNLAAGHGDFRIINFMARTVLRNDMDGIDAIMIMRPSVRLRIRRPGPQKAACPGEHRPGKTGISHGPHLDLIFQASAG
jgi:hypothetical protein